MCACAWATFVLSIPGNVPSFCIEFICCPFGHLSKFIVILILSLLLYHSFARSPYKPNVFVRMSACKLTQKDQFVLEKLKKRVCVCRIDKENWNKWIGVDQNNCGREENGDTEKNKKRTFSRLEGTFQCRRMSIKDAAF